MSTTVDIKTSEGELVSLSPEQALTLKSIQDAARETAPAKKGNGRKASAPKQSKHEDSKPTSTPVYTLTRKDKEEDPATTLGAAYSAQHGAPRTTGEDAIRLFKDQEKQARKAEQDRIANARAAEVISSFHNEDLDVEISSLMAQAEKEMTDLEQALEVRKEFNLRKLALDAGRAQFQANFSSELAWVKGMRIDLSKNSVAINGPLAKKVNDIAAKLAAYEEAAVAPLKKALDEFKPKHEAALKIINENDHFWQERKSQGGDAYHK